MKPGRKKTKREGTVTGSTDSPPVESSTAGSDTPVPESRNNPEGIDGIRALQLLAIGFVILLLVWFVLHSILRII